MKKLSFNIKYFILVFIVIIGFSSNLHIASAHMTYAPFSISYTVVPNSPTGSLTVSPSSCVIADNASTCSVTGASWSTSNTTNRKLVDGNTNITLSTNANQSSSPSLQVYVAYPATVYNLMDGGNLLATRQATATCGSNSTWDTNTNKCLANPPTGSLTALSNSCTILTNQSTCPVNLTWWTNNASSAVNIWDGSNSFYAGVNNSPTPSPVTVHYPSTIFYLRDGSTIINSPGPGITAPITANCSGTDTWDGSNCVATTSLQPFINSLTILPTTGKANIISPTITWSVSNNPITCVASGDWSGNKTPASGGNEPLGVLSQSKTYSYTLTCSNAYGSSTQSTKTATITPQVNPVIKVKEI